MNTATQKVPRINYHQTKIKTHQKGIKVSFPQEQDLKHNKLAIIYFLVVVKFKYFPQNSKLIFEV